MTRALTLLAGLLLVMAVAVWAAPDVAPLDTIRQVGPQTSAAALALAVFGLGLRAPRAAVLAGAAAAVFALPVVGAATTAPARPGAAQITVFFHNIHDGRADPAALLTLIDQQQPDIVALVEAWPHLIRPLRARLQEDHPYTIAQPDVMETAVFSRWPLREISVTHPDWPSGRYLVAETPLGPVRLAVVHLSRPWPFTDPVFQHTEVAHVAQNLAGATPTILVGDFNAAPWGYVGAQLRKAGLRPAGGLAGTWPAKGLALARIPIDNGFSSGGLIATGKRVLPATGSDHLPVLFTFERE